MTVSRIAPQSLVRLATTRATGTAHAPSVAPSLRCMLIARLFSARLDQAVEQCAPVASGSALGVHVARLTSTAERQRLAAGLRSAVHAAQHHPGRMSAQVAVRRDEVNAAKDLIDTVLMTLDAPLPVRARGMARARLLLTDGAGPLYATGSGSLTAALRGVLAAL